MQKLGTYGICIIIVLCYLSALTTSADTCQASLDYLLSRERTLWGGVGNVLQLEAAVDFTTGNFYLVWLSDEIVETQGTSQPVRFLKGGLFGPSGAQLSPVKTISSSLEGPYEESFASSPHVFFNPIRKEFLLLFATNSGIRGQWISANGRLIPGRILVLNFRDIPSEGATDIFLDTSAYNSVNDEYLLAITIRDRNTGDEFNRDRIFLVRIDGTAQPVGPLMKLAESDGFGFTVQVRFAPRVNRYFVMWRGQQTRFGILTSTLEPFSPRRSIPGLPNFYIAYSAASGKFAVLWGDLFGSPIKGRLVDLDGNWVGPTSIVAAENLQPIIANPGTGGFLVGRTLLTYVGKFLRPVAENIRVTCRLTGIGSPELIYNARTKEFLALYGSPKGRSFTLFVRRVKSVPPK